MKKILLKEKRIRVKEPEPFNKRRVDVTRFKPDIPPKAMLKFFTLPKDAALFPFFFFPIDTLSVTKTVGKGGTNLTFIEPTIVQADAATPYAGFDRNVSPSRNPIMQMHFEPGAYGITSVSSYVMAFAIETVGPCTFDLRGGPITPANAGTRTLNGKISVSLVFHNVPPSQQIYAYLEQTAGNQWNFYSVRARYPYLVIGA